MLPSAQRVRAPGVGVPFPLDPPEAPPELDDPPEPVIPPWWEQVPGPDDDEYVPSAHVSAPAGRAGSRMITVTELARNAAAITDLTRLRPDGGRQAAEQDRGRQRDTESPEP